MSFVAQLKRELESERRGDSTTTWYYLIGDRGIVQFMILFTAGFDVLPADLGYHSPKPIYETQESMQCPVSKKYGFGPDCYYDGSGLMARDLYEKFLAGGEDPEIIWQELEAFYNDTFL